MSRLIFVLFFIFSVNAQAYRVEPMSAEMRPFGKHAQMSMRIGNPASVPLTVELYAYHMKIDEQGIKTISPADDELLVIPVTAIIPPGRSQTIMVRYIGDPSIRKSKAFQVSVKQVNVSGTNSVPKKLGFLLNFDTSIIVSPEKSEAKLAIKSIVQNKDSWLVEIENSGNRYGKLNKKPWLVSDGNKDVLLSGYDVSKLLDGTIVLPYSVRFFKMKPLDEFNPYTLSMQIVEER